MYVCIIIYTYIYICIHGPDEIPSIYIYIYIIHTYIYIHIYIWMKLNLIWTMLAFVIKCEG